MNFYVTVESDKKMRNAFTNLGSFYIINVDSLIKESGLDLEKPSHSYLINSEIERLISIGAKSKRYNGIIYINSLLNGELILSIKNALSSERDSQIENFTLLDDYDLPKLKKYYKLFDEVIFFPTLKKTKIIHCTSLSLKKTKK